MRVSKVDFCSAFRHEANSFPASLIANPGYGSSQQSVSNSDLLSRGLRLAGLRNARRSFKLHKSYIEQKRNANATVKRL